VRLDDEFEEMLRKASQALAMTQSEFIRDALQRRCREVLNETLADRLKPYIGTIESTGGRAEGSGKAFRRLLARRKAR